MHTEITRKATEIQHGRQNIYIADHVGIGNPFDSLGGNAGISHDEWEASTALEQGRLGVDERWAVVRGEKDEGIIEQISLF